MHLLTALTLLQILTYLSLALSLLFAYFYWLYIRIDIYLPFQVLILLSAFICLLYVGKEVYPLKYSDYPLAFVYLFISLNAAGLFYFLVNIGKWLLAGKRGQVMADQAFTQEIALYSCLLLADSKDGKLLIIEINKAGTRFCQQYGVLFKENYREMDWYDIFPDLPGRWLDEYRKAASQPNYSSEKLYDYWDTQNCYLNWKVSNISFKRKRLALTWMDATENARLLNQLKKQTLKETT